MAGVIMVHSIKVSVEGVYVLFVKRAVKKFLGKAIGIDLCRRDSRQDIRRCHRNSNSSICRRSSPFEQGCSHSPSVAQPWPHYQSKYFIDEPSVTARV